MDVSTTELWRGFDAWLNRDSSRSPDEITPNSAICFVCDCLHDRMAADDPVTGRPPWNQNLCPECWKYRRPKPRRNWWKRDDRRRGLARQPP
jgi:hypothetical protein